MDLRLDVTEHDGWSVIDVGGEIDVATAPRLREQLLTLVNGGRYWLVLNLAATDFIDSTGLGVLISGLKRTRTHGGDLAVVCTEPRILRVFEITGLDGVFGIHASVEAATAPRAETTGGRRG